MKIHLGLSYFYKPLSIIIVALLVGCSVRKDGGIQRIALLAPFEGRNSEIGYDAYYAVRLALQEHGNDHIELLAIDDGGSEESAAIRAKALATDPFVKVAIILGNNATKPEAQAAFGNVPMIIVGHWQTKPASKKTYMLASAQLETFLTPFDYDVAVTEAADMQNAVIGGEVFAMTQFPLLSKNTDNITIVSSANLPDADFRQRYLSAGEYVPEPGLLATLGYDAAGIAIQAIGSSNINQSIANNTYNGLNGAIHFEDGYWAEAPIHYFHYVNGKLTPEDRPVK